jgi:hypothetical protein
MCLVFAELSDDELNTSFQQLDVDGIKFYYISVYI